MKKYIPKIIGAIINFIGFMFPSYAVELAIKIFSTPKKGRLNEKESTYLKSAIQEDIVYNGISIRTYHWKGAKETILLAHGWESNTHRWKSLIERLKSFGYNIVALDAPGHGASGNKTFNALLYSECMHLVAKKFNAEIVIGHSVGGMSTIFFQHKYQLPSIKKLVLLGAPATITDIFKSYVSMMGYNNKIAEGINHYVLKHYNHLPEHFSVANFSKEIKNKGLIIHDKKDRIIPFTDGLKIQQSYEDAQFIKTVGFGHGLKSRKIYDYVLDFLNA